MDEPKAWLAFLDSIFSGDRASIDCLQEWFGYCCTDDTSFQKAMVIVGPPRAGKSVIGNVLRDVVGRDHVILPTFTRLTERFGLADLANKALAIFTDYRLTPYVGRQDVIAKFLGITGEDLHTIDRKHKNNVIVKLPTRLMFIGNVHPVDSMSADPSGAFATRLLTLRLTKSFLAQEDHTLSARLAAETASIHNWAAAGYARLLANGQFTRSAAPATDAA